MPEGLQWVAPAPQIQLELARERRCGIERAHPENIAWPSLRADALEQAIEDRRHVRTLGRHQRRIRRAVGLDEMKDARAWVHAIEPRNDRRKQSQRRAIRRDRVKPEAGTGVDAGPGDGLEPRARAKQAAGTGIGEYRVERWRQLVAVPEGGDVQQSRGIAGVVVGERSRSSGPGPRPTAFV